MTWDHHYVPFTDALKRIWCLDRNTLKYTALACMVIDHAGQCFTEPDSALYLILSGVIGRFAFPFFAALFVEGLTRTHRLTRNICLTAGFAVVSEPLYDLMCTGTPFSPDQQNIMWVYLAFGLFYLVSVRTETRKKSLQIIRWFGLALLGLVLLLAARAANLDYKCWGLLGMMTGLPLYQKTGCVFTITWSVAVIEMIVWGSWACVIPMIVMVLYDPDKLCSHTALQKYSMYAAYPVHMGILDVLAAVFRCT